MTSCCSLKRASLACAPRLIAVYVHRQFPPTSQTTTTVQTTIRCWSIGVFVNEHTSLNPYYPSSWQHSIA